MSRGLLAGRPDVAALACGAGQFLLLAAVAPAWQLTHALRVCALLVVAGVGAGVAAIVLGRAARRRVVRSPGLARAGLVLGYVGVALTVLVVVLLAVDFVVGLAVLLHGCSSGPGC